MFVIFFLLEGHGIVGADRYRNKEDSGKIPVPFLRINYANGVIFQPYVDLVHGDSPPH